MSRLCGYLTAIVTCWSMITFMAWREFFSIILGSNVHNSTEALIHFLRSCKFLNCLRNLWKRVEKDLRCVKPNIFLSDFFFLLLFSQMEKKKSELRKNILVKHVCFHLWKQVKDRKIIWFLSCIKQNSMCETKWKRKIQGGNKIMFFFPLVFTHEKKNVFLCLKINPLFTDEKLTKIFYIILANLFFATRSQTQKGK